MSTKSFDDLSSVIMDKAILHGLWLTWEDSDQLAKSLRQQFDSDVTSDRIAEAIEGIRPTVLEREKRSGQDLAQQVLDLQKRVEVLEQALLKSSKLRKANPKMEKAASTAKKPYVAKPSIGGSNLP